MKVHHINSSRLTVSSVNELLRSGVQLQLSPESFEGIKKCRDFLDKILTDKPDAVHYGINTGFGALHNTRINAQDLEKVQRNLVLSHACGNGEEVPTEIVKLMLLLKIQGLSYGHSGTQPATVQRLIDQYNQECYPAIYQQGSLGASGDLAPLAHLALPLIGEGEICCKGEKMDSAVMLKRNGWSAITLRSKEGLALLNGTQFMSAYGMWCVIEAQQLSRVCDIVSMISFEAFDGKSDPFKENVNRIRNQVGQNETAEFLRSLLEGSALAASTKKQTQDPYSFRCIPQVHGAAKDTIRFTTEIFEREINAVTDNPTIFPDSGEIISGGNFHGEPLAMALDYLSIALAELGSISERRIFRLISGERDLPVFLAKNPGLNSGFMIPQYTAASIASQNKQLAVPACTDSLESSNGQEDHVSMGANAATKCYRVVQNLRSIAGIELLVACQALEFRRPSKSSKRLEKVVSDFRKIVPFSSNDEYLYPLIQKAISFTKQIV